jgi:hypothetical protein
MVRWILATTVPARTTQTSFNSMSFFYGNYIDYSWPYIWAMVRPLHLLISPYLSYSSRSQSYLFFPRTPALPSSPLPSSSAARSSPRHRLLSYFILRRGLPSFSPPPATFPARRSSSVRSRRSRSAWGGLRGAARRGRSGEVKRRGAGCVSGAARRSGAGRAACAE